MDEDRIAPIFKGRHILLTGSTGFMGKVFVEKLLRITEVDKIYLLMRVKKGKNPKDRLVDMFNNPIFDIVKKQMGIDAMINKIVIITGDCALEGLGISEEQRQLIINNVTLMYHFAATIRFDEKLKKAVELNTRGTREMIKLGKECKKLDMFGYMSTSYCHLHESFLLEKPYDPPADPNKIINSIEILTEEEVEKMVKKILGNLPNSYAFTKALAEALVNDACQKENLPAMILRPSIVIPTLEDPIRGWTDNLNGPAGMMIGAGKGVIRTIYCDQKSYGDFLPVDVAINGLMVCTWNYIQFNDKEHYIVNFTSSQDIQVTWEAILEMGQEIINEKYPLNQILWYPGGGMSKYRWVHKIKAFLFHWIPALLIDTLLFCLGFKPILWRVHERIAKGMEVLEYYANNQWDFDNKHAIIIRARMNKTELKKYKVDAKGIDIYKYFEDCILGGRRYLLKQPDSMLPSARRMMKVMYVIDRFCKTIIYGGLLYWLIKRLLPLFFTREALNNFYSSIFNTANVS
ncbi:hypothetical protein PVAND_010076 [Polypedilum vanderplanki]|uniref:Fatty acyl-CoA reductase n=1 Tax=Polypedilum vanderplanki TaxID=319348 RepID=A0A9J6CFL5_POLVA|nr:hypothetical protein PVAND_010076 [Polypedilum vanderplanki]